IGEAHAYERISKMIAELIADDVLAIYCTTTNRVHPSSPTDAQSLRTGNLLDLVGSLPKDLIVSARADDPELAAATAEAMRRWPEFATAFKTPGAGTRFAVKKAFVERNMVEHMWVAIDVIDGALLRGHLNNMPE